MPPLIIITLVKLADSLKMFNKSIVEQGILQTSGKEPFYVISYAFLLDIRLVKAKLFLCSSPKEVSHEASRGSIPVAENIVYFNRYHQLVNAIDTNKSLFRGWILIRSSIQVMLCSIPVMEHRHV